MRIIDKILTGLAVISVVLGMASIESTPIWLPLLMIVGGGAWIIYYVNAYQWER